MARFRRRSSVERLVEPRSGPADPEGQSTGCEHRANHPADEPGFEVRNLGPHAGNVRPLLGAQIGGLHRQPRVEAGNFCPHLGEAGRKLIGRDVVAVLGGQTDRVRDGVRLGRRELGVGQRAGDSVRVKHVQQQAWDA